MPNRYELSQAYEWDKNRGASIHNHAIEIARNALVASGMPAETVELVSNDRLISPESWTAIDGLVYAAYIRHLESGVSLGNVPGTVTVNRRTRHERQLEHAA